MNLKPTSILLLAAGFGVFLFFFVLKCLHLQRCDYSSDLFCHFQLSHDWLIGKPLFYENCFGFHYKIHNYFIDPLLSPFTWLFGVYGLFVALFCLIAGSFFMVFKLLDQHSALFETKLLVFILYTCPLSFFVFHNEHYGFHVETLLIPLTLLFCVTYLQKNKWYLLWGALIVLVKEDASIVLWSCLSIMLFKSLDMKSVTLKEFCRNILGLSLVCLLVFMAGLLWLKWMNNWGNIRSVDVFGKLQGVSFTDLKNSFAYLIGQRMQLTVFLLLIVYLYAGWKYTMAAVLISVPLLITNLFAGTYYSSDGEAGIKNMFSLLWVPRLSMYWAYWFGVIVVAFTYKRAFLATPSRFLLLSGGLCCGILLVSFQVDFFRRCELTHFDTLKSIKESFEPAFQNDKDFELVVAASIAKQLPPHYPVAPMDRVFGAFHRQDIVWLHNICFAYYPPRIILASYNKNDIPENITEVMKHPLFMLYREKLHIYCEAEDTCYISKAGIRGTWIDQTAK